MLFNLIVPKSNQVLHVCNVQDMRIHLNLKSVRKTTVTITIAKHFDAYVS